MQKVSRLFQDKVDCMRRVFVFLLVLLAFQACRQGESAVDGAANAATDAVYMLRPHEELPSEVVDDQSFRKSSWLAP